jgi:hypothetical protein
MNIASGKISGVILLLFPWSGWRNPSHNSARGCAVLMMLLLMSPSLLVLVFFQSNQINRSRTIEIPSNYHSWWTLSARSFFVSSCPGRPRWCAIMAGPPRVEYMASVVVAVVHPDSNLASLSWPVAVTTLSRKATEFQLDEDVSCWCCYCCWTMTSVWWAVDCARPEFGISHRTDDTCERQSTCNIIGRPRFSCAGGRPDVVAIE